MMTSRAVFLQRTTWMLFITLLILIIYYLINIGNNYVEGKQKIKINNKIIIPFFIGLITIVLMRSLFKEYAILSDTFYTVIFSIILAYLFNPIINYLESKNINRLWGVLLLYLIIVMIVLIFAFLVIPRSSREIKRLMVDFPYYLDKASGLIDFLYNEYYSTMGDLPPIFQGVQQVIMENIVEIGRAHV